MCFCKWKESYSMLILKGNPDASLENKLNEMSEVKNIKVFVVCQKNA